MIVSCYIIYTLHFDRPGIKLTICKITYFSIVTSICPKYCCTQLSCAKNSRGEIYLQCEPKIDKVKFFTQNPTKISFISVLTLEVA